MDLSLTEEQELLRNTARDFMEREGPKETLLEFDESDTGFSADIWQKASDIGWLGMLVAEEYGGSGEFADGRRGRLRATWRRAAVRAVLLVRRPRRFDSVRGGER